MKTNFVKKTIKISTAVFLTFFLLFVYVKAEPQEFNLEEQLKMSEKGESTMGIEQPSTDNDQDNDGTNDAFETDNPANFRTMKGKTDSSGKKFIYTLLQPLPQEGEDLQKNVTLKKYLTWAFRFTLALAGFLAVMMIVIGGVEYIISGANESSRSDAKKRINSAISGLVLALVSYLVLYTINPSLVDFENNCFFKDCDKKTTTSSGNKEQSYNDGTDYIEGTKNPLTKPNLDTSGIGDSASKEDDSNYNDGTDYIEGTENPLDKPKLKY